MYVFDYVHLLFRFFYTCLFIVLFGLTLYISDSTNMQYYITDLQYRYKYIKTAIKNKKNQ